MKFPWQKKEDKSPAKKSNADIVFEDYQKRYTQAYNNLHSVEAKAYEQIGELTRVETEILSKFSIFIYFMGKFDKQPKFKKIELEGVNYGKLSLENIHQASVNAMVLSMASDNHYWEKAAPIGMEGMSAICSVGDNPMDVAKLTVSGGLVAYAASTLSSIGLVVAGGVFGPAIALGGLVIPVIDDFLKNKKVIDDVAQMMKMTEDMNNSAKVLKELGKIAESFSDTLKLLLGVYEDQIDEFGKIVYEHLQNGVIKPHQLSYRQGAVIENVNLLVGILFKLVQTKLIRPGATDNDMKVNRDEVKSARKAGLSLLEKVTESPLD